MSTKLVLKSLELVSRKKSSESIIKKHYPKGSIVKKKKTKNTRGKNEGTSVDMFQRNMKKLLSKKKSNSSIDSDLILGYLSGKSKTVSSTKQEQNQGPSDFDEKDFDFGKSILFDDEEDDYDAEPTKKKKEPVYQRKK